MLKYRLEILLVGAEDPLESFSSETPFIGFSVGDTLVPYSWNKNYSKSCRFKVVLVEHSLFSDDDGKRLTHSIDVFVEHVAGTGTTADADKATAQ